MSERSRNILGSQRAQDVLICKLCTQYLRDPRQLPCGHSFCLPCLERYYRSECQRSESGRRRSPSVERRRRGLLPCPAAPVCLHVSIVPDEGVSAFPVNQRIADIKEHVVNEMAYNISQRMGRPHITRGGFETDTASVRSDETDFSDISCETSSSAPAAGSSDSPDSRSPYPNLAKYAKYFEAEKDDGFGSSSKYRSGLRSERRRVAISSSFQHRRRRVHTPSPAAFDDSTRDVRSHQPSRSGSAPHLDSDSTTYRPTLRPRQGSSMVSSPLLRRAARPASCIVEELVDEDDYQLFNHIGETSTFSETPRRATSTEQHTHRVLPTHSENISMDDDRKSMPARDESSGLGRHFVDDAKTDHSSSKTMAGQVEPPSQSKHHSGEMETGKNSSNTVPSRDEFSKHGKHQSEKSDTYNVNNTSSGTVSDDGTVQSKHHSENTNSTSNNAVPVCTEPISHAIPLDTDVPSQSTTSTLAEEARNSKSHADDVKGIKHSTSVSSKPGRRVLPNIPSDRNAAETSSSLHDSHGNDVHPESTADVRRARKLPTVPNIASKDHGLHGHVHKYPDVSKFSASDKQKSSTANLSGSNKSRSSSTTFSDKDKQKTTDSRSSANVHGSKSATVKSSSSDSLHTRQSTSGRLHNMDRSKPSVSGNKSSSRESSVSQKSHDLGKSAATHTTSHSKSASSSKPNGTERMISSQTTPDNRGFESPKSAHREDSSREQKGPQSECSSADKSRTSKSTPGSGGNGSGSRLTYKVNAATIQPVLMNSKKKQNSPPRTEHENSNTQETVLNENCEMEEQDGDVVASAQDGGNIEQQSPATSPVAATVNQPNGFNESDSKRGLSGVDKDDDHNTGPLPSLSSQSLQTDVNSKTEGESGSSKYQSHTNASLSRQLSSTTDDEAVVTANDNKDAKNNKKTQQWNDFMTILQAARSKYSTTDNRTPVSQTSRPVPVLGDGIVPCWQIQRDDFAVPSSIAIADDGFAVIADVANCLIDFADTEGNIVHSVTGTKPFSVAIGTDGSIYVGDRRSRTVRVFDMYGSDVAQWDAEMTSFGWIAGIAVLRNGQLAVVDRERCKVGIYTTSGERVTEFGSYGTKDAQLCMADFVAVDSHDRVIVSDSGNHHLKLFDPTAGKLVATFGGRGNADGCLLWPKGLTVDRADHIIVADGGNDRICQFADDGRFVENLVSGAARPYHVNCGGGGRLLGVTHFALNNASQVDVFTISSVS